jgi:hypothetical protein
MKSEITIIDWHNTLLMLEFLEWGFGAFIGKNPYSNQYYIHITFLK